MGELSCNVGRSLMFLDVSTDKGFYIANKSIITLEKRCLEMGEKYVSSLWINQHLLDARFGMQKQKVA